ncbi:LacI family DNA-binding transcriptional regulator [Kribbella sp. NPDC051586]|uniref:LacI family DNA-binding transcriptional regulator n=1 Tax=Kribbella sp. NPDC051586 TaxID=3364118 RepID=UPI0037A511A8
MAEGEKSEGSRPPTIEMVAAKAGVGRQTVSYAINQPQRVAAPTLARVRAAIEELGYRPNRVARSLRTQSTRTIGYRVQPTPHGLPSPVLDRFVHALAGTARQAGYNILLCAAEDDTEELEVYGELIQSAAVDAFVLSDPVYADPRPAWLADRGVPSVSFGRIWGLEHASAWVDVDGAAGTRAAVDHLVENGHRDIAFLGLPADRATVDDRFRGWRSAMHHHGLSTSGLTTRGAARSLEEAQRLAAKLLGKRRPTAVVASHDLLAIACYHEAERLGLTVGTDLAVVGFDDSPPASMARPGLSSVSQPLESVGAEIVRLVVGILAGELPRDHEVVLAPELVIRGSSGPVQVQSRNSSSSS